MDIRKHPYTVFEIKKRHAIVRATHRKAQRERSDAMKITIAATNTWLIKRRIWA